MAPEGGAAAGAPAPLVRRAGGHAVRAWRWHGLDQLRADIGWRDPGDCLCADLALGAWRGHWLAREWGAQLGLPEPAPLQPALGAGEDAAARHADTVARLVDNESAGDLNFGAALRFVDALAAALQTRCVRHLLLVAPLPGHAWGEENLQLLRLLVDAAAQYGFGLALLLRADADAPHLPGIAVQVMNAPAPVAASSAPWCAVPGLLDWAPHDPAIETLRLAGGRVLVSPNARPAQVGAEPPRAGLPAHLRVPFALRAHRQDVAFLQHEAGLRFAEGAYDLAFAILDGIRRDALDPLAAALVAAQQQNIAIALMDFARAAAGPVPADNLPAAVRASLFQSKAWGLVMTGDAAGAEPWFARARQLLDPRRQQRLYLYLMNISALARLRQGDAASALAFERDIERQLLVMERPDWHLVYINCLNQARIFKKLGDFGQAERYYARGFHVTHQLRNESDLLYANLCQAQLATLQDRHEEAVAHWLRAALHWLSNPCPEALAPRVAQAVLGRPLSNRAGGVEPIARALEAQLRQACLQLGLDVRPAPHVIPLHRVTPSSRPDACIGQPGWSVMTSAQAHGPLPFDGPACHDLDRLALGLMDALAPGTGLLDAAAVLTDHRDGIDLPAAPREVLWSCLRWRAPLLRFGGRDYRVPPRLDAAPDFLVERSRAIDTIETGATPWRAHFRRYRPPLGLDADEQACLAGLDGPLRLADLAPLLGRELGATVDLVVRMMDKRLLSVA